MKTLTILMTAALLCMGCSQPSNVRGQHEAAPQNLLLNLKAAGKLRVGVKEDAPPFGFKLGEDYAGFEIDVLGAVARELGIGQIEYVPVVSSERTQKLLNGEVDLVMANMTITRSREQDIDFSLPYFQDGQMLLVSKDSAIQNYLDLAGKSVACIKGTTGEKNIQIVAPSAQIKSYQTNKEMLAALNAGEVEAITTDAVVLEGIRNKNPDAGYKVVGEHFSVESLAIGFVENQSDLRDAINETLQRMAETGEWQTIYDTWFGGNSGYVHLREFHIQTFQP